MLVVAGYTPAGQDGIEGEDQEEEEVPLPRCEEEG